jgi:hypothetical protein
MAQELRRATCSPRSEGRTRRESGPDMTETKRTTREEARTVGDAIGLARLAACGGYGAVYGAFVFRTASRGGVPGLVARQTKLFAGCAPRVLDG